MVDFNLFLNVLIIDANLILTIEHANKISKLYYTELCINESLVVNFLQFKYQILSNKKHYKRNVNFWNFKLLYNFLLLFLFYFYYRHAKLKINNKIELDYNIITTKCLFKCIDNFFISIELIKFLYFKNIYLKDKKKILIKK